MEAVNTVLGGGLRVGVLLQGKKIRDDNKTLVQTGISHDNKMDTLGFTLEPSPAPAPIRSYPEDSPGQLLCDNPQPLSGYSLICVLCLTNSYGWLRMRRFAVQRRWSANSLLGLSPGIRLLLASLKMLVNRGIKIFIQIIMDVSAIS